MRATILILSILVLALNTNAQKLWHGKKSAVCLTYDDAKSCHLDIVIPQLNKYGLKGTFYLTGYASTMNNRIPEWRDAAAQGHELGNHTLFHPCRGKSDPKRGDWVGSDMDLDHYSLKRFVLEIKVANNFLNAIDGKNKRTYAYTCGHMLVDGTDMAGFLPDYVLGARSTNPGYKTKDEIDVYNVPSFPVHEHTAEQIIEKIEKAKETNSLIVLLFHSVGGGNLNIETEEHEKLLQYLSKNQEELWITPFIDAVEYIR